MSDGVKQIAQAVEGAALAARSAEQRSYEREQRKMRGLPNDCPVVALGLKDNMFYYMDACRQLRVLAAEKHGNTNLKSLFAPYIEVCETHWPRYGKPDKDTGHCEVIGVAWSDVQDALMNACAEVGPIDVERLVRASGAWLGGDGQLVMHCGTKIFSGDQVFDPGKIGSHIYPAAPKLPYPHESAVDEAPAQEVLSMIRTWNWERPEVDPFLMIGWIGAAMMGGALDWRPLVWVTGDKGTGKSTLQKVVRHIIGESALIYSTDATEAGIRQAVGRSSLPVALDEIEAEEDGRKGQGIIKLARTAGSEGQTLRGGADHKGATFTLMNCFMFSSILIPPMLGQDISRMAILRLSRLEERKAFSLKPDQLKQIGRAMRRRLMDQWPLFNETLEGFRMALSAKGHSARNCDQFGTLLACMYVLCYADRPHDDYLEEWGERLEFSNLAEAQDDLADWQRCLDHLLTSQVDCFRHGERKMVADLISAACGNDTDMSSDAANRALRSYGMAVKVHYKPAHFLSFRVANAHQGLRKIFKETHWADRSGASGVWSQSLRNVPGAMASKNGTTFAGGKTVRFIEMPIERVLSDEGQSQFNLQNNAQHNDGGSFNA